MSPLAMYRRISDSRLQATAFLFALTAAFAMRIPALMGVYLLIALAVVALNLRAFSEASIKERNAATVFVLALTVMLPIGILKSETAMLHYAVVMISMGAAFVLTRNLSVYHQASRLTLLAAQCAVFAYLSRRGLVGFPLNDMIPDSSANGVTSYMVLLQANYCVINYLLTRRSSLVTSTLTLAICIVGFGRGSILSAAVILGFGLVAKLPTRSYVRALLGLPLAIAGGILISAEYGEVISDFVIANTKIGSGLYDAHRETMIREYLDRIDGLTLLTGASYTGTSILSEYNGNPHNSFIRAHYFFGLPYLLLIFLLPLYLLDRAHALSVKVYAAGIWLVVFFRSFTEPVLFPTLFDFYYFGMCFALAKRTRPRPQPQQTANQDAHASVARAQ